MDHRSAGHATSDFSGFATHYVGTSDTLSLRERSNADGTGTKATVGFDYDSGLDSLGMARRADGAATGTYASFAKDANGSIEGLAGTAGAYSSRNAYDPYGNTQDVAAVPGQTQAMKDEANDQPFRFQGFYLDSGVKTYDMRARQYLPQAGRFLTQDRFESSQGDFNLVSDPLIQSRYAFAGGNPISNVEFDGHCPIKNRCPGTRKGTPGGRSKAPSSGGDRDGSGGPNGDGRLNSGRRPVPAPPSSGGAPGTDQTSSNRTSGPVSKPRDDSDGSVVRKPKKKSGVLGGVKDSIDETVDAVKRPKEAIKGLGGALTHPRRTAQALAESCNNRTTANCLGYAAASLAGGKGTGGVARSGVRRSLDDAAPTNPTFGDDPYNPSAVAERQAQRRRDLGLNPNPSLDIPEQPGSRFPSTRRGHAERNVNPDEEHSRVAKGQGGRGARGSRGAR